MSKFIIKGGTPLKGEITISGNKNAALPIIAATVLTDEDCTLTNVPDILDVKAMFNILENLGKTVTKKEQGVFHISGAASHSNPSPDLVERLRASILYLGALLGRHRAATIAPPGGCVIGKRGLDVHVDVFCGMGVSLDFSGGSYAATLKKEKPSKLFLQEASVTATENALLLAATIDQETIIDNAACEPHVKDLADVLIKMGANIQGAGSNRIVIKGNKTLSGFSHDIVADNIEAGTFMVAALCTQGDILIRNIRKEHLFMPTFFMKLMGAEPEFIDEKTVRVKYQKPLTAPSRKIQVGLWPGFPTDLMSPMVVLATQAQGATLCHDWMFESRMFFCDKLVGMGANITICDPHRVIVNGASSLKGQHLSSPDLRAGIALVIAAMSAEGESTIDNADIIDRGYERVVPRLQALGANIERVE